jgi:Rieske 2Fe-2S family protein
VEETVAVRKPLERASTLPRWFYHDPSIYELEVERFLTRMWLCTGREEDVANPGDFLVRDIGNESVILVRGQDGRVRAFHNVCRHRGTRLVEDSGCSKTKAFQCEYHTWTYGLDGKLLGAPLMDNVQDFDRAEYGLLPLATETWGGFVFINLDPGAQPLHQSLGAFMDKWKRFPLSELRRGGRLEYDIAANWKILCENYSECYHCAPVHPDLNRITRYDSGENDTYMSRNKLGPYSGGYMAFTGDYTSMTLSGYSKRPPIRGGTEEDRRRIYYYLVFPNMFFSLDPDYLMVHTIWPQGPERSRVECDFYFDPPAMADPSFDPTDVTEMWDRINRQDWRVCELTHRGTASKYARAGRYSETEDLVHDFDAFIADGLN